jgi:hypothetical protein
MEEFDFISVNNMIRVVYPAYIGGARQQAIMNDEISYLWQ